MDVLKQTPELWVQNENTLLTYLMNDEIWNSIPLLNANDLQNLKNSTLVRFRGMVQDMYDLEYYYEKYNVVNSETSETSIRSGKYLDTGYCEEMESFQLESKDSVLSERHTFVVISAPAANAWVTNVETKKYTMPVNESFEANSQSSSKRAVHEMDMESEETQNGPSGNGDEKDTHNKKLRSVSSVENHSPSTLFSADYLLNFPLINRVGKACHVKIYKDNEKLKLNEFCEFVGFLSVDPYLSHENNLINEFESKLEIEVHNPPPSLIPRIHCITWKKLKHNNPLAVNENFPADKMAHLKTELLVVLTQLLLGDNLAAEYLLYHLLSTVYIRKDFLAIGKFSLNISNIPIIENGIYTEELYKFLESLLPQSHYLPMTLENMNRLSFIPKKDYECNRVTSGILQLNDSTHLVLDETKLQAGKLNQSGVKAVSALAKAIKTQTVEYDFGFSSVKDFDCDIPFLILSEGKSLLPSDRHVPLIPDNECVKTFMEIAEAAKHFLSEELLNNIRIYLTLARLGEYSISDECNEIVESEFVRMRQNGKATGEDLHQLLVLARLICLSEGKIVLDEVCWRKACSLEEERKRRLP